MSLQLLAPWNYYTVQCERQIYSIMKAMDEAHTSLTL